MGAQQGKTYTAGFHVLNVQPNSPGEEAGLVSFFDYIVVANGVDLDRENSFAEILKENVGKPVEICIYSSRDEGVRVTTVTPRDNWGGKGLLGLSIRFCQLKGAGEFVWHILDVYPQSPASAAGLNAHTDYIVGAADVVFSSSDDFFNLINAKMGEVVRLYVYNSVTEEIRLVTIVPNRNWGGEGSLGCDVGYGLLHKIPASSGKVKPKSIAQPVVGPKTTPSADDLISELAATPLITPNASSILTSSPPSTPPVQVSSAAQPSPVVSAPSVPLPSVTLPTTAPSISPAITLPTVPSPILPSAVTVNSGVGASTVPPTISLPTMAIPTSISIPAIAPQVSVIPATTSASSSSISLPSTEQLQKQLEQLKLQQQRLQELRNKQLGVTPPAVSTSSPSNAPASILPSTGSDPSLAAPQLSAQTLTQLKLQALAAKQQQQ
eukprot:TRINITY_DN1199_c0_g1_i2.p1 TRINITY_DN1199_c0_g1~~TRINITY_DN1199_c0_g1_i2.p1  ORF type:complete len:437 (+),score=84.34 TRINITY_DN1199_c0_g1_i2:161-1471(+)